MAIPVGSEPDKVEKPTPAPRTWEVKVIIIDSPGKRETYLTVEQIVNSVVYSNRVHGLHIVSSTAKIVSPSLGRKAQVVTEKEK